MELKSLNDKAKLSKNNNGQAELFFGTIKRNTDTMTELLFTGNRIEDLTLVKTCGCTIVGTEKIDDNNSKGTVKYDTKSLGVFKKTVKISFKENGEQKNSQIILKGTVVQ